ncbi:MAG: SUMF1/EgtB/PvdO family nonheme iron enzyme [Kiritimatiellae bacterium]|nr:SUMF1/EgtB/PvdO family nonheme iron enzyme [Kiritimatiellia bacterium]
MKYRLYTANILAILIFSSMVVSAEGADTNTFGLKLSGANPLSRETPSSQSKTPSCYFNQDYQTKMQLSALPTPKNFYRNIYPGIDLTCYGDEYQLEYIFTVSPGANPSLIRLLFEGIQSVSMTHTGGIRIIIPGGEIIQNTPVIYLESATSSSRADGMYEMGYDGAVTIDPGQLYSDKADKINNTRFNLVPAGGQPGGPNYNFYVSKFEITNDQFLRFLNDAEANTSTARGSNMFFDKLGNVWINPQMKRGNNEMFEIAGSQLSYDADKPAGSRYSHLRTKNGKTPYVNHPVTGVSWFGAIKYCNWLTIESGRGPSECCYTEGTNTIDWAPVTATNWANGHFGDAEREAWLAVKGFRLPMLNCPAGFITTNKFNEFYKAAAWAGNTNRLYGYGRDSFEGTDANYRDTLSRTNQHTFPIGYFNGNEYLGARRTRPNENFYGIFDLSGNAAEWMTDFGISGNPEFRTVCGGSWDTPSTPITTGKTAPAFATSSVGGFRVNTTYLPIESLRIHILYSFFMEEPATRAPTTAEELAAFAIMAMTPPESPQPEEVRPSGKPSGPRMDITAAGRQSDIIMPDGITYKPGVFQQPTIPSIVPGEQPSGQMPLPVPFIEGTKPFIPPSGTNNILIVTSINPNSGIFINVSPADNGGNSSGNTQFIRTYRYGTSVNLTAPANSGTSYFQQWLRNGAFFSAANAVNITLDTNTTMTAVYTTRYALAVNSVNPNSGMTIDINPADVTGNGDGNTQFTRLYSPGTIVNLTAPANSGTSYFQQWLRNGAFFSTNRTVNVIMDANTSMTAVYTTRYTLDVNSINPNSGVSIDITPADINGNGDDDTQFSRIYSSGAIVTLTAPPNAGTNIFVQWSRNGTFYTANPVATIAMVANITMTAVYVPPATTYTLTIRSSSPLSGVPITVNPLDNNGDGNGVTVFPRIYTVGSFVTVSAPPAAGDNIFQRWQMDGIDITTNLTTTIYMNGNHTVTAVYVYSPGPIDPPPISPSGV